MRTGPSVADYMARELITLQPELEINKAMHVLLRNRISGAPVVTGTGQLVGVLTKRDCMRAALEATYHHNLGGVVADYMARDPVTLPAELDIFAACERFLTSPYRRFPVLREGRLVGQISRTDVLRALTEQWN